MEALAETVVNRWSKNLTNDEMLDVVKGMMKNPIDNKNMDLCIAIKKVLNKC